MSFPAAMRLPERKWRTSMASESVSTINIYKSSGVRKFIVHQSRRFLPSTLAIFRLERATKIEAPTTVVVPLVHRRVALAASLLEIVVGFDGRSDRQRNH